MGAPSVVKSINILMMQLKSSFFTYPHVNIFLWHYVSFYNSILMAIKWSPIDGYLSYFQFVATTNKSSLAPFSHYFKISYCIPYIFFV